MKVVDVPEAVLGMDQVHGFADDFQGFLTAAAGQYQVITSVDGTVLQNDAMPGGVAIRSAAVTAGNEECHLARRGETFKPTAGKPIHFRAMVQATEDDVNQNNLIIGLTDAVAAGLLRDNGAGPKTAGTTIAIFKVDGGSYWQAHLSNGAVQTRIPLTAGDCLDRQDHSAIDGAWNQFDIIFAPKLNGRTAEVIFQINNVTVLKIPDWEYTGATDIQAVVGCKDGDAADETTINLRRWFCYQKN